MVAVIQVTPTCPWVLPRFRRQVSEFPSSMRSGFHLHHFPPWRRGTARLSIKRQPLSGSVSTSHLSRFACSPPPSRSVIFKASMNSFSAAVCTRQVFDERFRPAVW